jgi:hypothetical protein
MKLNRTPVFWGISAALLLGSTCSEALTLGRVRGAALLGKPLDLSVLVQYAADEDVSSACFEADVQYGDTPLERSRISVTTQPGSQPNSQVVRITSSAGVDEALVRLTLRAVCAPKASRQYTLLSDVVSDLAGAAAVARIATSAEAVDRPTGASTMAGSAKPVAAAPAVPVTTASTGAAQARPAAVAPRQVVQQKARPSVKQAMPATHAIASSKGSPVNAAALEDLQRRVDEIAQRQAGSSADEALKSEARTKALESDIRGLQLVTAKNQQNIQMVATALENQASQDYTRPLAYGLGGLLLACLAALAYVAQRMRSSGFSAAPWWSGEPGQAPSQAALAAARATVPGALGTHHSRPVGLDAASAKARDTSQGSGPASLEANPDTGAGTVSMDFTAPAPVLLAEPHAGDLARAARPDFAPSAPGNMKSINTREMLDVRQQAEFFMALGQHDEAVRLLESSIRGSADCNPLVFLDLLKIFHTLSRRADFERYREEFNAQFTGRIPPYASFLSEGNGLDAYEDICNQIVVLWPTEYTIDYIEQCLVRLPEDDPEQGMDLEAFRDLLMLYGVLKRLDQGYDSNLAPFSTSRSEQSQNAPLVAVMTAPLPITPAGGFDAATAPMDIDLDLDLNLDELGDPVLPSPQNNLIDFDMSDYIAQKKSDSPT